MLKIYGVTRSRASRIVWLAEEMGLAYEQIPVIQRGRVPDADAETTLHTRSPAFLAVNPNGHIPSIDDDGLVLHESLAITLHLAMKHGGPLAPATEAERGQMLSWTFWAADEVEPHAIVVLYGRGDRGAALSALAPAFAILDRALAETGWLVGGRFTIADLNAAEIVRYAEGAEELFAAAPNVRSWLDACHARPAFRTMWAKRQAEPA